MLISREIRAILNENFDRDRLARWFEILDEIRDSGKMNMYLASSVLEQLGLDRKVATAVTRAWMATFDADKSMEARVEEAYEEVYSILKN
jgi:hypothetical protein